jgi:hypothetical protein
MPPVIPSLHAFLKDVEMRLVRQVPPLPARAMSSVLTLHSVIYLGFGMIPKSCSCFSNGAAVIPTSTACETMFLIALYFGSQ